MEDSLLSFAFLDSCRVWQKIPKKFFEESDCFTPADRRLFAINVAEVRLAYLLNSEKTRLTAIVDDECDYSCLAVIYISLRSQLRLGRIVELCHRAMPYPLLLVLQADGRLLFSMADKRLSRDGCNMMVIKRDVVTAWYEGNALNEFFANAAYTSFTGRTFVELYKWYFERFVALNVAKITGIFSVGTVDADRRCELLSEVYDLDSKIATAKRQISPNMSLGNRIEFNTNLKGLERARAEKVRELN